MTQSSTEPGSARAASAPSKTFVGSPGPKGFQAAEPVDPFKPGQVVHGGKYKLKQRVGDLRYSWMWVAEPVEGGSSSSSTGSRGSSSSRGGSSDGLQQGKGGAENVVIKVGARWHSGIQAWRHLLGAGQFAIDSHMVPEIMSEIMA